MEKIPVIVDCDPGHDDAIALVTALASEQLQILGITAAPGNQTVEKTSENIRKILELCHREEIPVAKGRTAPLMQSLQVGKELHGETGMDGPILPPVRMKLSELTAAELMAELIEQSPRPVTLIVTGPCTNVAVLLLAYPHLRFKIEKISLMGGGAYIGNRSALAEFNIWNDPEAAKVVADSGIPLEVYGLDVTHKALIYQEEIEWFRKEKGEVFRFVTELLDFFAGSYLRERKFPGCPMHDSCAVIGVIRPDIFEYRSTPVSVELNSRYSRGALVLDLRENGSGEKNGKIAMDVRREKVLELIFESCRLLREKGAENAAENFDRL